MRAQILRKTGLGVVLCAMLLASSGGAGAQTGRASGAVELSRALVKAGEAELDSCNGGVDLTYPDATPWAAFGDTVGVRITFWTGSVQGGLGVEVYRVRFMLDCEGFPGMPCSDAGLFAGYAGNLKTTCPVVWAANLEPGTFLPNDLILTADKSFTIPPREPQFCSVSFDVRLADDAPGPLEEEGRLGQAAGILASLNDAVCLTRSMTPLDSSSVGLLRLCPDCDDGNVCTEDACERSAPPGEDPCRHKELRCEDGDPCTADGCDPQAGCVFSPLACDDGDPCTSDSCDPASGCAHEPRPCGDGDPCTTDSCDPASGACVHPPVVCDDGNGCTADACDPETGMCVFSARDTEPPVLSVSLSPDILWPPDHRLVPVTAVIGVADACDPDPASPSSPSPATRPARAAAGEGAPATSRVSCPAPTTGSSRCAPRGRRMARAGSTRSPTARWTPSGNAAEATALVRVPLR